MKFSISKIGLFVILLGVIFRVAQYLFNKSLWLDEAFISLNIIDKSYSQLFGALDYKQGAPVGFLIVEKFLVQLFGDSEYVFRFFPLVCGIVSLFLFYKLAKGFLDSKSSLLVLTLFAVMEPLIYFSSEVKQYSSDVTVSIILFMLAMYMQRETLNISTALICGLIGAVVMWFSHPAIFIILGISCVLMLLHTQSKEWKKLDMLFISTGIWLLNLFFLYSFNFSMLKKSGIEYFGENNFMPIPPTFNWLYERFLDVFNTMQLRFLEIPQILFIIGAVYLYLRKRGLFFLFLSSIPFALISSGFHVYPYVHRLLLFLVPVYLLFVGAGFEKIADISRRFKFSTIAILAILLTYNPVLKAFDHLKHPHTSQEIRPVLKHIKEHEKVGDIIYVYHSAQYAFKYYAKKLGFNNEFNVDPSEYASDPFLNRLYVKDGKSTIVLGIISVYDKEAYKRDLAKLKGNKRVWFLFSHIWPDERETFMRYLDSIGRKIDSVEHPGYYYGSSVYLYDLN